MWWQFLKHYHTNSAYQSQWRTEYHMWDQHWGFQSWQRPSRWTTSCRTYPVLVPVVRSTLGSHVPKWCERSSRGFRWDGAPWTLPNRPTPTDPLLMTSLPAELWSAWNNPKPQYSFTVWFSSETWFWNLMTMLYCKYYYGTAVRLCLLPY